MKVSDFDNAWQHRFPDCLPVAYWLRDLLPERWVRFHSLPGSKRYPETESEYATLLERHNRILGELVSAGEPVFLLSTGYSDHPEPVRSYPELLKLDPGAVPWRTVAMHEVDAGWSSPWFWHIFVNERRWTTGTFDPLVRLIADDVVANIMIVAPDCTWLVHPYDGGMDVILETTAQRDSLKAKYSGWLSAREDGL
jgi:hypothetical protein